LVGVLFGDGIDLLADDLLEELLHLGDGVLVLRPGHEAAVAEAPEQVIDGLEAHQDAEFLLQDPTDIGSPEGTDTIFGPRWSLQALLQPGILLGVEQGRSPAARPLVERLETAAVVLRDPVLDGAERTAQGRSDVLGGAALLGEDDGLNAPPESFLGD